MAKVHVSRPDAAEKERLGITGWGEWGCSTSTFPWEYDEKETCFIIEGEVEVEAEGKTYHLTPGDLVVFPKGLRCTWRVIKPVRKYYRFG